MPVPCHAEVMTCHVIAVISFVCHKSRTGVSDQTYFYFLFPAPLRNAHAHKEKYGWLARLITAS